LNKGLLERLNAGEILICDGSTGIALQSMGCNLGESVEKWGFEHSDILMDLHANYIDAGADIILTDTLGGSKIKLKKFGLENEVESLNKGLAELARNVVSRYTKIVYVAGNVGPTGELMEPYGTLSESDMIESFSQQIKALINGGVDFIFIETMIDVNEAVSAIKATKALCDLPIFASIAFDPGKNGFRTVMGNTPEQAVDRLQSAGADVVGSNCGSVLASMMPDLIKQMKSAGAKLIAVEPNAGIPQIINGRTVFPETPQEMAVHVPAMIDAGANVVGGCCGVMAEHIRLIAKTAREYISKKNQV
jgi:5-methyltetrahydrofolate--homocysteine methyltransferase